MITEHGLSSEGMVVFCRWKTLGNVMHAAHFICFSPNPTRCHLPAHDEHSEARRAILGRQGGTFRSSLAPRFIRLTSHPRKVGNGQ